MSIGKLSFITTAIAVVLAAVNVIIHAVKHSDSMLWPMILLGLMVAAFVFSLFVLSNEKKSDSDTDDGDDDCDDDE